MYEKIKRWFIQGLWTNDMVIRAAEKGVITKEEAEDILGQEE